MSHRIERVWICDRCSATASTVSATRPQYDVPSAHPVPDRWWRWQGFDLCPDCAHVGHEHQRAWEAYAAARDGACDPAFREASALYQRAYTARAEWCAAHPPPVPPWKAAP